MKQKRETQKKQKEKIGSKNLIIQKKNEKGITLIALVITIIVLIILAMVSIAMLTGQNGLLNKSVEAKIENEHGEVRERLQLEEQAYLVERLSGSSTETLLDYLKSKEYIKEDGKTVNVKKLTGKQDFITGNGENGKNVYKIEEKTVETGSITKLASKEPVKIAASGDSNIKEYSINYYDENGNKKEIGLIVDNPGLEDLGTGSSSTQKKTITFTIEGTEYTAEEGMTWEQWIKSEYGTAFSDYEVRESGSTRYIGDSQGEEQCISKESHSHNHVYPPCVGCVAPEDPIISDFEYFICKFHWAECVKGDSDIRVSISGEVKQAKDIQEGQDIAYYNKETDKVEIGTVAKVYIHKNATDFVRYTFEDGTYLEATSYHPIYTKEGWKSYTRRNGYPVPQEGDEIKTPNGWKKLTKIETYEGLEDCYDFAITSKDGKKVDNYYANGTLVQNSIK